MKHLREVAGTTQGVAGGCRSRTLRLHVVTHGGFEVPGSRLTKTEVLAEKAGGATGATIRGRKGKQNEGQQTCRRHWSEFLRNAVQTQTREGSPEDV